MKKKYIVHVGISGFPYGSAPINKCLAVYNILALGGIDVLIINNRAIHKRTSPYLLKKKSFFENIQYIYTTPTPYKPDSFIKRRFYNIIGRINEFFLILNLVSKKKIDVLIFYPKGLFFELLYYRFLSKIFGLKIISHYVEYRTAFTSRKKSWLRVNDILFDKYFMKFIDGAFPISEFLIKHLKERGFKKPYIKIPPIVDYKLFNHNKKNLDKVNYFLYVGSVGYSEAIEMILNAFNLLRNEDYYLYLVLSGKKSELKKIRLYIKEFSKYNRIKIFTNLDYIKLIELYLNAKALLIPLSNRIQDVARFPHKIAEYLASGNPIITTNNGEVKYYFKDKENALVGNEYNELSILSSMEFVIKNKAKAERIGEKGYQTGLQYFDSNNYKLKLRTFIENIIKKS